MEVADEFGHKKDNGGELIIEPSVKMHRRHLGYLDYVLSPCISIANIMENYEVLSFTDMADVVQSAREQDQVVTLR